MVGCRSFVQFYLGTPTPAWLQDPDFEGVPLFVSRRRLVYAEQQGAIRARTRWALDSGAFTEISMHGRWTVPAKQYAQEAVRWNREVGKLDTAVSQDLMCEPEMLTKTGLSVVEHQILTTRSFLELRELAPEIPWMPVLQGYAPEEYLRHVDRFDRVGVDLTKERVVGIGSVCRREDTAEAEDMIQALYRLGIRVHGFGFKFGGLLRAGKYMESADSMAWSYKARFGPVKLSDCTHRDCRNCSRYALVWRRQLLQRLGNVL